MAETSAKRMKLAGKIVKRKGVGGSRAARIRKRVKKTLDRAYK